MVTESYGELICRVADECLELTTKNCTPGLLEALFDLYCYEQDNL